MTGLSQADLAAVLLQLEKAGAETTGSLRAQQIAGGRSNLTFRLDDGRSAWVLRMPPRTGRTPSAHDVAREFRVTRALQATNVPVAKAVVLCEDESVIGLPFAVSEFVEGRTLQSREDLNALDDAALSVCVDHLAEALSSLHQVDHVAAGLEKFGKPTGYAERQIRRWSGQWEIVGDPILTDAATLSRRLGESAPEQQSVGIVHGDFRIDNTILDLENDARVAAVVDWELSTIGDPVADVAMMAVYRHPAFDLVIGSPTAWASDRIPSPDQLGQIYAAAGGVPLTNWEFHLALGYFKLAVIAAGIDYRYRAGATTGAGFDTAGAAVPELLSAGLQVLSA